MKALAFTAIIALLAGDASAQEVTAHKAAFGYIMESFVAGNSVVPEVMHRIDDDVEFDASDWHCSAYKPRSGANQRITMEVGCSQLCPGHRLRSRSCQQERCAVHTTAG